MISLLLSSYLVTHILPDDFQREFIPLPLSMSDKIEGLHKSLCLEFTNICQTKFSGVWSPEYDEENLYPLMFRSRESLTRFFAKNT